MKNCPNCNKEVPTEFEVCWNCQFDFILKKLVLQDDFRNIETRLLKIDCLRCNEPMNFADQLKLSQEYKRPVTGEIGHLFTNNAKFDAYVCLNCKKVEFFLP